MKQRGPVPDRPAPAHQPSALKEGTTNVHEPCQPLRAAHMTTEDYRMGLLSEQHLADLKARVAAEEDEVVEDAWDAELAAGLDAADRAWADRRWSE
jgi:hypothetical protein